MSNHFYRWMRYEILWRIAHKTRVFYDVSSRTSNCSRNTVASFLSLPLAFISRALSRRREKEREKSELLHLHLVLMHRRSVKAPLYRSIAWQRGTDNVALRGRWPLRGYRTFERERWNRTLKHLAKYNITNIISRTQRSLLVLSCAPRSISSRNISDLRVEVQKFGKNFESARKNTHSCVCSDFPFCIYKKKKKNREIKQMPPSALIKEISE